MKNRSVLFIDDDVQVLHALCRTLQDEDLDIHCADSGGAALSLVSTIPFAVVVCDLRMPGMDGPDVLASIKLHSPETMQLILTGQADVDLFLRSINHANVSQVLLKPWDNEQLVCVINECVRQYNLSIENQTLKEDIERITRHDLKAPLTAIVTIPQILKKLLAPEGRILELIDGIESAGYRMLDMINLSFDLYRMEQCTYQFRAVCVDVSLVVERILREQATEIARKRLQVQIQVDGEEAQEGYRFLLPGEELLLYSMFSNLLKNAIEASPEEHVISIEFTESGEEYQIRIVNAGVVPEPVRKCFFEKYATAGKSGGTGLGTYSARLIARIHGGDLLMETSDDNDSTRVCFCLPKQHVVPFAKGGNHAVA